jgi:hypothetical protein
MTERPYDLLLEWASERGSGTWQKFRDACEWLRPAASRPGWETPGFAARQMSALGHLEIDWQASSWTAAPPVLTLLPSAGGHALLTGGRTRTLKDRLREELSKRVDLFAPDPHEQTLAPSAYLIASESERSILELADALQVRFTYSVSTQLARLLPSLDSYLSLAHSQRAPAGYGVQRFDPLSLNWSDAEDDFALGFYRYDAPQGPRFRLVESRTSVFAVNRDLGVYAALSRWGESRMRYFAGTINGELEVPLRAPLPTLHARAAVLCSGLAPEKRGRSLIYVNVPAEVAEAIARSLDQSLALVDTEPGTTPDLAQD